MNDPLWMDDALRPGRHTVEHARGQPIRVKRTGPPVCSWCVELPDGTRWEGIQARDVKECRAKLEKQLGRRLPPGTRCSRMKGA